MAEGRMLKRVISTSPRLAALKNDTHRLIYTWLIPFLDVEGRMEADSRIVKGHVIPLLDHITSKIIDSALRDMAANDLIILYAANGNKYLQVQRFEKHQNIRKDREKGSDIPGPLPEDSRTTPGGVPDDAGSTPARARPFKLSEVKLSYSARFELFWSAYPKKKSKGQAESTFLKIKPDEQLLASMIAKIEQAKKSEDWMKDNGKYIPHPATWLNAKGWEDEIVPDSKPSGGNGNGLPDVWTICPRCKKETQKANLDGAGCIYCAEPTQAQTLEDEDPPFSDFDPKPEPPGHDRKGGKPI